MLFYYFAYFNNFFKTKNFILFLFIKLFLNKFCFKLKKFYINSKFY